MTLKIGDVAPDFTLPTDTNDTVQLSQLRGQRVILFFYPKDNTPGCTQEACDFRDHHEFFAKKNTVILGISKDSQASHQKFKTKYNLPFTLLVDAHGDVCEAYGVINKKSMFGKTFLGVVRTTVVIDEAGRIQALWRKVRVKGHVEELMNEFN